MVASYGRVVAAMVNEHGYTPADAAAAVERNREVLDKGVRLGSYTYYVVGKILTAEGHECGPTCKDDDDGDEE